MSEYRSEMFTQEFVDSFNQHQLAFDRILSDADVKAILQSSHRMQTPDKQSRITRIDGIDHSQVGYVSCLGTKAVLGERILSALHHFHSGAISAIVFICDSKETAWWKQNTDKSKQTAGDGNRSSAKDLQNHLLTLTWVQVPTMIHVIRSEEAGLAFNKFHAP